MKNEGIHKVLASARLLIEQCDDGALVFNLETGATTLLNDRAAGLLRCLLSLGQLTEADLCSAMKILWGDVSDFSSIFSSLEKSQLVFRC